VRTVLYLVVLIVSTVWYSLKAIIVGLLPIKRVPGGVHDNVGRDWARICLRAAGVPVSVEGAEHLRADEPQIVASNHASFFDILAIYGYLPVPVKFVAKKELFAIPIFGQALRAVGHVRLDRTHLKQAFGAYQSAARQIIEGRLNMLIFPEGTRTRTGELLPFKKGPFVLAIMAKAPVVPAYVANTFGIQPKGSIVVHPRPIRILIGPRVPVDGLTLDDRDALTERVRTAVAVLKDRVDAEQRGGQVSAHL
jgi:1-acyl-sn-glycerol-3-phosphate acyltransferase